MTLEFKASGKLSQELKTLETFLARPDVARLFIRTESNIKRLWDGVKTRSIGEAVPGGPKQQPELRDINEENLTTALMRFVACQDFTIIRPSPEQIAQAERERNARAITIEEERLKNDPVFQARIRAERERIEAEAKAVADAADKAYWTERAQKRPGENSLQCLQRYRRERVAAGKEVESSFAHSANILTPVMPVGITVHDPKQGTTQIVPLPASEPGTPDSGNWDVNNAFVTTAKARNRG